MKNLQNTLAFLVTQCEKLAIDGYQISLNNSHTFGGSVRKQVVVNIEDATDTHLSVALYKNNKRSVAASFCVEQAAMLKVIDNAYALLPFLEPDDAYILPEKTDIAWDYKPIEQTHCPDELTLEKAIEKAKHCEQIALDYSPQIFNSEGTSFSISNNQKGLCNSLGFQGFYQQTGYGFDCSVLAKDSKGNMQYGFEHTQSVNTKNLKTLNWVGEQAAKEACDMLGATTIKTQNAPVILRSDIAKNIISDLLKAISGYAQYQQESFLLHGLNKQCMPRYAHLTESPTRLGSIFSQPFDGEGVGVCSKNIIENGQLLIYLLDTYTAKKLNMKTTGHCGGASNIDFFMEGQHTVKDLKTLCQKMDTGLLVTRVMGAGTQIVTGNYSTGASGFWVENGQIQHPVDGLTIAGNLKTILMSMHCVAQDVLHSSNIQTGSILLDSLSISST